jgi:hypothetical protein
MAKDLLATTAAFSIAAFLALRLNFVCIELPVPAQLNDLNAATTGDAGAGAPLGAENDVSVASAA